MQIQVGLELTELAPSSQSKELLLTRDDACAVHDLQLLVAGGLLHRVSSKWSCREIRSLQNSNLAVRFHIKSVLRGQQDTKECLHHRVPKSDFSGRQKRREKGGGEEGKRVRERTGPEAERMREKGGRKGAHLR